MINTVLKNFCLITFALIAPITLPAGGIQKSLNRDKFPHNTNEITLSSDISLYK
jgi:hypothetical protein